MEIFRRPFHLLCQLADHLVAVAAEEIHQLLNDGTVLFPALAANTGPTAHLDVIVETGAFILAVDVTFTVEIGEDATQRVKRLVTGAAAGIGAKIARPVLAHLTHDLNFGKIVLPVDLDVGELFVVFEANIIARAVALDQLIFEDQRL